jgi:hypothetical protein
VAVLDVGCGTGALAVAAFARGARVTGTDVSASMVERMAARAEAVQLPISARIADGRSLPLEFSGAFGAAVSNFGVIFVQPASEGVQEMLRCVRPGGVVALTAWGEHHETEAFQLIPTLARRLFGDSAAAGAPSVAKSEAPPLFPPLPSSRPPSLPPSLPPASTPAMTPTVTPTATPSAPPPVPAPPQLSAPPPPDSRLQGSPSSLRDLLSSAGLESVRIIGPITRHLRCPTAAAFWDRFALAAPGARRLLHSLSASQQEELKQAVLEALHARFGAGPVEIPASAYVAVGVGRQPPPVRVGTAGFAGVTGHWAGKGVFPPGARTAKGDAALDFYQVGPKPVQKDQAFFPPFSPGRARGPPPKIASILFFVLTRWGSGAASKNSRHFIFRSHQVGLGERLPKIAGILLFVQPMPAKRGARRPSLAKKKGLQQLKLGGCGLLSEGLQTVKFRPWESKQISGARFFSGTIHSIAGGPPPPPRYSACKPANPAPTITTFFNFSS